MFDLDDWHKGDDIFEAAHHQKAVAALKQLGNNLAGDGLIQFQTPAGTSLSVDVPPGVPGTGLWVTVGGDEAGVAMYYGYEFPLAGDEIDPDDDLTLAMLGAAEEEEIVIVNAMEIGSSASSPFLASGSTYPAEWHPATTPDGRRIAVVRAIDPDICT